MAHMIMSTAADQYRIDLAQAVVPDSELAALGSRRVRAQRLRRRQGGVRAVKSGVGMEPQLASARMIMERGGIFA